MLRDFDATREDRRPFALFNIVSEFGRETEYEEIKVILRKYYSELKRTFDEKGYRIEGTVTNDRLRGIISELKNLIHQFYFVNRFK